MIGFLLALTGLAALASFASLLANVSGQVAIEWGGYTIDMSLAALLGAMAGLLLMALALFWLGHILWHMPEKLRQSRMAQKRETGEAALADALMALARGDAAAADKATALARQKLPDRALPLLMSAQAALLDGQPDRAEADYRAMLGAAATGAQRILGLEGLFYLAQRQGDSEAAGTHALRVLELAPKTLWALEGLMALSVRIGDWEAARAWLRRWSRAGVKRAQLKRRRAILALAEAQSLMASTAPGDHAAALQKAEQAVRLDGELVPAIALSARLLATHGQLAKAKRVLRAAWGRQPHRELANAWLDCMADQPSAGWMRAVAPMLGKQKTHEESHLLRARIALRTQRWSLARTLLEPLAKAAGASRLVYELLGDAAKGEGDEAALLSWQDKARKARPEAGWMAAGMRLGAWQAVCPVTGQLDQVRWQSPQEGDMPAALMLGASMPDAAAQTALSHQSNCPG